MLAPHTIELFAHLLREALLKEAEAQRLADLAIRARRSQTAAPRTTRGDAP